MRPFLCFLGEWGIKAWLSGFPVWIATPAKYEIKIEDGRNISLRENNSGYIDIMFINNNVLTAKKLVRALISLDMQYPYHSFLFANGLLRCIKFRKHINITNMLINKKISTRKAKMGSLGDMRLLFSYPEES